MTRATGPKQGETKAATWDNLMANTDTTGKDAYGNFWRQQLLGQIIRSKRNDHHFCWCWVMLQVLKDAAYNADTYATSITTGTPGRLQDATCNCW